MIKIITDEKSFTISKKILETKCPNSLLLKCMIDKKSNQMNKVIEINTIKFYF